jgi:hypothetical protein
MSVDGEQAAAFLGHEVRLSPVAEEAEQRDFFEVARRWAAIALIAAGVLGVVGSMLDWITITVRPSLSQNIDFGTQREGIETPKKTEPFTGLEAGEGYYVLGAGVVQVAAGALLLLHRRARYAWLGLLAAVVVGAIAFADFRGVGDLSSSISRRMEIVGRARPALGLTLVAAAAFVGVLGAAAGIAASPKPNREASGGQSPSTA